MTDWFVLNGWFSIWRPLVGISLITEISPKIKDVEYPTPDIVPTPTDSWGLKKAVLFTADSNLSTDFEIVNESGKKDTEVPSLWDTPDNPLLTLKIFSFRYISRIFNVSVPTEILLPIETSSGTGATYISVVNPADATLVTVERHLPLV